MVIWLYGFVCLLKSCFGLNVGKLSLGMCNEQRKNLNLDYFGDFEGLCVMWANVGKCRWGVGGVGSQCGYGANTPLVKKNFFEI